MAQIILDSNNNLIQGDFDNATLNNRTKLQTTTTNATTNVYVVPNGSSTSAGVSVANNSSLTNASKIVMATNGSTDTQIISGVNGSGTYLPLSFYTNNALAMQITTAGNIVVASTAAPAFSVNLATSTTISLGAYVKVPFNSEVFDTNNNFDSSTNYRFTPTVAGYYQINLLMISSASVTGALPVIYKNGSQLTGGTIAAGVSGIACGTTTYTLTYLNGTTDYVEAYMYQTGNANISGGVGGCNFSGFLARSA
jgi:hypothetical protein